MIFSRHIKMALLQQLIVENNICCKTASSPNIIETSFEYITSLSHFVSFLSFYILVYWLKNKKYMLFYCRSSEETTKERSEPWSPSTVEQVLEVVNKQKAPVLYYSLAAGRLYAWLLQPHKGEKTRSVNKTCLCFLLYIQNII